MSSESSFVRIGCRRMRAVIGIATIVITNQFRTSECFNSLQTSGSSRRLRDESRTSLSFRENTENAGTFFNTEKFAMHPASRLTSESVKRSASTSDQNSVSGLPTWLTFDDGHIKDAKISALREFMRDSFFTDREISILVNAIEDASEGCSKKTAGAAEFCLLLAETMEMGLDALTAAAFHYCSCVTAREQAAQSYTLGMDMLASSTFTRQQKSAKYGSEVVEIEADVARLKQLELVAASVFAYSEGRSGRVTPGKHDAENLRHLLLTETKDWRALAIRSAACLYRLRGILKSNRRDLTKEFVRTAREALLIYAPLASRMGMHRLKNELEGTAFRILYRRQYRAVTSLQTRSPSGKSVHTNLAESMHLVLELVKADVTRILENDPEFQRQVSEFSVSARVKEPYSMWKKMLRLGYDHILQVPDALALRIVLDAKKLSRDEPDDVTHAREQALCYYAQKLCQSEFKPVSGNPRFKDYIAKPKRNGYQSLHYTASTTWEDEEWTLEVQVRSGAMHGVAEFGIACHCDYKAQNKKQDSIPSNIENISDDIDKSSDAYVRNLQKWRGGKMKTVDNIESVAISDMWHSRGRDRWIRKRTERLKPYLKALTDVQSNLVRDHVFVFLTQQVPSEDGNNYPITGEGKVIALPAGACVLDALRQSERTLGRPFCGNQGFALNGSEASVTRQLQNGDVLGISCQSRMAVMA